MRQSKRAVNNTANVIAAFDFDGTITTRDTFLPFLGAAFGRRRLTGALMRLALDVMGSSGRMRSRDALKARLIAILFTGRDCSPLDVAARDFATRITTHLLRPRALERVRWHRERGHRLVLISASLDIYLTHLVERLGFDDLLCTRLSRRDAVFDGRLVGNNCRGAHGSKSSLAAARDIRFMPTATPPAIAKCCGPRTFHSAGASARGMTTPNVALVAARALMAGGIRSDSAAFASPPPPQHAGEHPA